MHEATSENIKKILQLEFQPEICEVMDESHLHAGHAGAKKNGGSHFRLRIVSECFEGKTMLERHRSIQDFVFSKFKDQIHALAIQAYTPGEWGLKKK